MKTKALSPGMGILLAILMIIAAAALMRLQQSQRGQRRL